MALKLLSFRAAREFGVTAMSMETEAGNVRRSQPITAPPLGDDG